MSTETAVVPVGPVEEDYGLGDVNTNVVPRLSAQKDGTFKNNITNEVVPTLRCIILGLVKQRVMWDAEVKEGEQKPLCRSSDALKGFPGTGFPTSRATAGIVNDDGTRDCASCPLKEWGDDGSKPQCAEQLVLAVLVDGDSPALLTFQRASVKPTNTYLSDFRRRKTGAFTHWTTIDLEVKTRGQVQYSLPIFTKSEATDTEKHPFFRETFLGIREFLTRPRAENETESPTTSEQAAPKRQAPVVVEDDDEVPF